MNRLACTLLSGCAVACFAQAAPESIDWPISLQDVTWDSPSADARGSMPIGNGDIGANVWVEPSGDLVLLIGKSDSFDEFNRLLKLGRIRVRTTPALVQPGKPFQQVLHLADGAIEIKTPTAKLRVWVDANHPVVETDLSSTTPMEAELILDNWRTESRELTKSEQHSCHGNWPDKMRVNADTVFPHGTAELAWCHHNVESQWTRNLELTSLGDEIGKGQDPILHRTFGALVKASGCVAVSDCSLKTSAPVTELSVQVFPLTRIAETPATWLKTAESEGARVSEPVESRFGAHQAWWQAFWNRSWIDISEASSPSLTSAGRLQIGHDSDASRVTRAYALQRFVSACAGRGSLPIKFNGSLFTVEGHDPDFRQWGGGYWWQNTREPYWPMLYAGDYDEMLPLFAMYRNALPLREAATRKYYGHAGAFFPETTYFWGNYMDVNYGIDRKGKPDGLTDNPYIRRYWQSGIELVAMMLDYFDGTQNTAFLDDTLLPVAKDVTLFYAQHWPAGKDGKILFDPAQSLETWHSAKNPLPEIAGLRFVLPRLLALPADAGTKDLWRKLLADLPAVPTVTENGQTRITAAETFNQKRNVENPELYGVFPYRIYTAMTGGEELSEGLNAWRHRAHPEDHGWQQNCIQAALLGLTGEAKSMVVSRAAATAHGYRFPGFFGPNYDWTPEQCHGTNLMTALQRMLIQCEGDRIVLTPAWPAGWNATFKLHAPRNTTVEGRIEHGKVTRLKVTPESRRKDVTVQPAS